MPLPRSSTIALALAFCLLSGSASAQVNPIHPMAGVFPQYLLLWSDSLQSQDVSRAEQLRIDPLGDIDNSGTDDFAVVARLHYNGEVPSEELFIYRGFEEGVDPTTVVPDTIRLPEGGASIRVTGASDFDADGHRDLCLEILFSGDTTGGASENGSPIWRTVIFWNDGTGRFSFADTSRLNHAFVASDVMSNSDPIIFDFNSDGVDDICLDVGKPLVDGERIPAPGRYLYFGTRGKRWGRDNKPATPDWWWWNAPTSSSAWLHDQDCDSRPDLVFLNSSNEMQVYYGGSDYDRFGVPDTTDVETVDLAPVNGTGSPLKGHGSPAIFEDVTSDGVLDLVVAADDQWFRTYVGQPGIRLEEMYGSGDEPADSSNTRYPDRRPWALTPMPARLTAGWGRPGRIYSLGDVHGDGFTDIWSYASRRVMVYSTGPEFDALIDGYYDRIGGDLHDIIRVGDLDGSGNTKYAALNGTRASIVQIFENTPAVPNTGVRHPIPSGHEQTGTTPNRCNSTVGVDTSPSLPSVLDLSRQGN